AVAVEVAEGVLGWPRRPVPTAVRRRVVAAVLGVQDVKTRRRARPLDRQQEVRPLGEETRRNGEARLVGEADGDAGGAEAEGVAPPPSQSQPHALGGDAEERPSRERLPEHLRERPGDGEVAPYFVEPGEVARDGL